MMVYTESLRLYNSFVALKMSADSNSESSKVHVALGNTCFVETFLLIN